MLAPIAIETKVPQCSRYDLTDVPTVPQTGPYTILAPTDDAINAALQTLSAAAGLGPEQQLTVEDLLAVPQIRTVLDYHILPGLYNTSYFRNDTELNTTASNDLYIARMGGNIYLDDSCIDRPTLDPYTCEQQKSFGQCWQPFLISAADWPGGYCQRTCQRCSCADGSCAEIVIENLMADNGIIQGITRILFPPRKFVKSFAPAPEQAAEAAASGAGLGLPGAGTGLPPAGPNNAALSQLLGTSGAAAPPPPAAVQAQAGP